MELAVHQPMAKPILHTKFHQNRTMGLRSAPALYIMESKGSDPFKRNLWEQDNFSKIQKEAITKTLLSIAPAPI